MLRLRSQPAFCRFARYACRLDRAEIDRYFEFADRFKPQFPHPFVGNAKSVVLPSADSAIDSPMSNLIVLDFDGIHTADEVLNKLRSLQKEQLIDLEDACLLERDKGSKVYIKQAVNMTALGAARGGGMGAFWGTLVGLLFLNPVDPAESANS